MEVPFLSVIGKEGRACSPVNEEVLDEALVQFVDMMPANVRPFVFQESPRPNGRPKPEDRPHFQADLRILELRIPDFELNSGFELGVEPWWPQPFNQPVQLMPSLE